MGYLIGGTTRAGLIASATDADFQKARESGLTKLPSLSPARGSLGATPQGFRSVTSAITDVTRTAPLFNDPRYTSSTLAIPTDDRTLHGLFRFFAETDAIVGSALRIHTELPLADMRLGMCEDTGVQQHFEEMWDRINGHKHLSDVTSEYHEIGTVVPFGAFNEADYMWDQIAILNPDYVKIDTVWVNQKPLIKLIPDDALKRVVQTQSPRYIYDQIPPEIIRYVLFNQEIPLDANNTFLIAHAKRPYEVKGKSLIKRILKVLMLEDRFNQANFALATRHAVPLTVVKVGDPASNWIPDQTEIDAVRDMFCYDEQTEVLTDSGFKYYQDVQKADKVACFNSATEGLEYHIPTARHKFQYKGDMIHFCSRSTDSMVTPNHGMLVERTGIWSRVLADQVNYKDHFRACVQNWEGRSILQWLDIAGKKVRATDWFKFAGWYLAEGSVYDSGVIISQSPTSAYIPELTKLLRRLPWRDFHDKSGWTHVLRNYNLREAVVSEFGQGSTQKSIPQWMLHAPKKYLALLLEAYLRGDGHERPLQNGKRAFSASTVSSQLANNIQEIVLKLGYGSRIHSYIPVGVQEGKPHSQVYVVDATTDRHTSFPGLHDAETRVLAKRKKYEPRQPIRVGRGHIRWDLVNLQEVLDTAGSADAAGKALGCTGAQVRNRMRQQGIQVQKPGQRYGQFDWSQNKNIQRVPYTGFVWCFTVPTGYFVTRRNGYVSIHGNSAYELDPNFTIFYHFGINVEYYGSNGKMLPIGPELDRIYRLKFIGMGVHEQLIAGQGGTYSQAYINLEVQRQRYLNLQLKLESYVHNGLFKPVADLCGFYKVRQPTAGYAKVSSTRWGSTDTFQRTLLSQFSSLRDFKDNEEFRKYVIRKTEEYQNQQLRQVREYVYPKLDWGSMAAATDESLKNWIKWLSDKRPWLVDDATLTRMARLDRDTQEKAYIADLRRKRGRVQQISKEGLLPFVVQQRPGAGGGEGGGVDLGGIGDIGIGGGEGVGPEGGGAPGAPIGAGGPPPAAGGQMPPAGTPTAAMLSLQEEIMKETTQDDLFFADENQKLIRVRADENRALVKVVNGR